jgi:hypothetical protein
LLARLDYSNLYMKLPQCLQVLEATSDLRLSVPFEKQIVQKCTMGTENRLEKWMHGATHCEP